MDPFGDDRVELTGSLVTMEFGQGGRITQLWASDPSLPDEGEDFQFVLPPLAFGEESSDDYAPGTILIGARTSPEEPWILSRNTHAFGLYSDGEEDSPLAHDRIGFQYDFPLLPEIQATGVFYEIAGIIPQICWEIEIRNNGTSPIEIGELGFPMAFNCFYDGFGWSDEQLKRLWTSRLYVHPFIGGAASWLFAQRMTAEPPGLLVFPGDDTGWEFYTHVPSSLTTPHQWEGIPVVYVYSKAAVEREGWKGWANNHTSIVLNPGERRNFQVRFVPTERDKQDGVFLALAACDRPAIRLLPSAVAPMDVGIAIEIGGAQPTRFSTSKEAHIETDSDEDGGFCFVRPNEPGPLRVSFEDTKGRISHVHLMFTDHIDELIKRRAKYIATHQVCHDVKSPLNRAILLVNSDTNTQIVDPEEYSGASGIECSLADALFLAEKNAHYPDRREIRVLDNYIADFLLDDVQNPGDMSVGSVLTETAGLGAYTGRPLTYPHVFNLYHAMYRIASTYGETAHKPKTYIRLAALTFLALFRFGWRHYVWTVGLLGYARIYDILDDLQREGLDDEHDALRSYVVEKAEQLVKQQYPYAGESVLDTSGFEEVFKAALFLSNDEHLERTMRCAYAARSLAPSWWWYGSDKRSWDGADSTPLKALMDRGEACLAHTTISNSLIFFEGLDRDYLAIPDAHLRLAFGGMMGPWALVRNDGAASMCYCPDLNSKHSGYNPFSGASGLGYFHYLRTATSYVLPNRTLGVITFGCHFEQDEQAYTVRPWDGVGRRIVLRQFGAEMSLGFGRFIELRLDMRKRWVEAKIHNPSDKDIRTEFRVKGLWGSQVQFQGKTLDANDGEFMIPVILPASQTITVTAHVLR